MERQQVSEELLEKQQKGASSDETLSLITKYLELHPQNGAEKVTLKIADNEGQLEVSTSTGIILNNMLPKETVIVFSEFGEFSKSKDMVWIHKNIESLGLFGKIALSHEFGHILSPDDNESTEKEKKASIAFKESTTDEGRIDALVVEQNSVMNSEIEAWNYGKAVADTLQIEEVLYEDMMNFALDHYFLRGLESIATSVDLESISLPYKKVSIVEPKSGQPIAMSIKELNNYINERYANNKILSADNIAKHSVNTYSKMN